MSLEYKDINAQSAAIVFSPVLSVKTQTSLSVPGEESFLREMTEKKHSGFPTASGEGKA